MWKKIKENAPTLAEFANADPRQTPLRDVDGFKVPEWWSDNAAMICRTRYANEQLGEKSAVDVCMRIANGWAHVAARDGYVESDRQKDLAWMYANIMLFQLAAPNSPQWFNTGVHLAGGRADSAGNWVWRPKGAWQPDDALEYPQVHACFINGVEDQLVGDGSIDDLWSRETRIFKHGSGSGANFSSVREAGAPLSGGGTSSGVMSFLNVGDSNAGAIKSGGTTRRAALMRVLDIDHPDIVDFVNWKSREEAKVAYLTEGSKIVSALAGGESIEGVDPVIVNRVKRMKEEGILDGYFSEMDTGWTSEAYRTVGGQNSNNSVRISDAFMWAVINDGDWELKSRVEGGNDRVVKARSLWNQIAEAAWLSADPAVQFADTINEQNTAANDGEIVASNPCCFVGDTLVDTSEGAIPIAELERMDAAGEKLPMAFCWDTENSVPDLKPITKAWVAGEATELVRVTTDSGKVFLCTKDHRWLLRSNEWVEAKDLKAGDSLREVKRYVKRNDSSRRSILQRPTDKAPYRSQSLPRWMWERAYGAIPEGMHVHHVNEDPTDDRLSNFELIEGGEHSRMHANHSGLNNPHAYKVTDQDLVETYDAVAAMELGRRGKRFNGTVTESRWNRYIDDNNLKGVIPKANYQGIQGLTWAELHRKMDDVRETVNASSTCRGIPSLCAEQDMVEFYDDVCAMDHGGRCGGIQGIAWDDFHEKMDEVRETVNDRVASVEIVKERRLVYDIEVEGTHNFGIKYSKDDKDSIVVSNSEYLYLNDTACNLASINLAAAYRMSGDAGVGYRALISELAYVMTIALDISINMASYPSEKIAEMTYKHRTLGLGFTGLGEYLAISGVAYGSIEGRRLAEQSMLSIWDTAYRASVDMADKLGPCDAWYDNKDHVGEVYGRKLDDVVEPVRNMQLTCIAPTGTISFVMDAGSTGIEPVFALKTWKTLAEGGGMWVVAPFIAEAFEAVHGRKPTGDEVDKILSGDIDDDMKAVIPTANEVSWQDHIAMMAAVQEYVCGAISKTVNMPESASVQDIKDVYMEAWKAELKCIAVYRDQSKLSQPLNVSDGDNNEHGSVDSTEVDSVVYDAGGGRNGRRKLPSKRKGYTQKVSIDSQSMYIRTGEFEDGTLGELFLDMGKEGGAYGGLLSAFAKAVSIGLQYGVPLEVFADSFIGTRMQPAGFVFGHDSVKMCTSPIDLIFKDLRLSYGGGTNGDPLGDDFGRNSVDAEVKSGKASEPCPECGGFDMVSTGTCSTCRDCGSTTGCA